MEYFELLKKLRKILRSVNLESKRIEKEHGVSIPQLLVLQFLGQQENYSSTSSGIKEFINLNASTVSGIIARLVKKGYIVKLVNDSDKRSTNIVLTATGLTFLASAPKTQQEKLAAKLSKLSDGQIKELHSNIDLLIDIMDIHNVDAGALLVPGEIV